MPNGGQQGLGVKAKHEELDRGTGNGREEKKDSKAEGWSEKQMRS